MYIDELFDGSRVRGARSGFSPSSRELEQLLVVVLCAAASRRGGGAKIGWGVMTRCPIGIGRLRLRLQEMSMRISGGT